MESFSLVSEFREHPTDRTDRTDRPTNSCSHKSHDEVGEAHLRHVPLLGGDRALPTIAGAPPRTGLIQRVDPLAYGPACRSSGRARRLIGSSYRRLTSRLGPSADAGIALVPLV